MVDIITIKIIVNLLSLEKFLSQYSAINPIAPNNIPEIPIDFPISKSINIPKISPNISPIFLPANSPTNSISITNKLGIMPNILNQVKKFACKKYIIKKANIINIIIPAFFIFAPFFICL